MDAVEFAQPTGCFELRIEEYVSTGRSKTLQDRGPGKRVEDGQGRFIVSLDAVAQVMSLDRERRRLEDEERQRALAERREQERREAYRAFLLRDVQEKAAEWRKADEMRGFLEAFKAARADDLNDQDRAWVAWLRSEVQNLDPLVGDSSCSRPLQVPEDRGAAGDWIERGARIPCSPDQFPVQPLRQSARKGLESQRKSWPSQSNRSSCRRISLYFPGVSGNGPQRRVRTRLPPPPFRLLLQRRLRSRNRNRRDSGGSAPDESIGTSVSLRFCLGRVLIGGTVKPSRVDGPAPRCGAFFMRSSIDGRFLEAARPLSSATEVGAVVPRSDRRGFGEASR